MRHSRIAAIAASILAIGLVAAGCGDNGGGKGGSSTGDKKASSAKKARVAVLFYTMTDYNQAQEKGLKAGLAENGGTYKIFVSNFDPSAQIKQCQDAITSGKYNAIVIIPVIPPTAVPCAKAAKAANIPLISADVPVGNDPSSVEPTVDGVTGQVIIPLSVSSQNQTDSVKKACEGIDPCEVIVELSSASDPVTTLPVKMIEDQIPNAKIVSKFVSGYDPAAVVKAMPDQLSAHPKVNVILFAADSSATAAFSIIDKAGLSDQIKSIGNGASVLGIEAIKSGEMFSTFGLYPQTAFKAVGEMAVKLANGEKLDPAGIDETKIGGPVVVTKENVDEVKAEWGATTGQ
jgi:ribose transport system substrate-binding protein